MTNAEKVVLIEDLRDNYDHVFISAEGVQHFTKPFGFIGKTFVHHANPDDPKGLTLRDGAASAEGRDAAEVAMAIARHLKLSPPDMWGRGSRLRAACNTIIEHLKQ